MPKAKFRLGDVVFYTHPDIEMPLQYTVRWVRWGVDGSWQYDVGIRKEDRPWDRVMLAEGDLSPTMAEAWTKIFNRD